MQNPMAKEQSDFDKVSLHHPSCTENDKDLVWFCNQCGAKESAEDIELDKKRLDWLDNAIRSGKSTEIRWPDGNKPIREAIDAAMKSQTDKP